ncbi:MAG: DUF1835 domain-containing protein [Pseudomonadota bacterium]
MTFSLALGDGAAEALAAAGHAGVRAFRDELSMGPLGDLADPDAFARRRAIYWASVLEGRPWAGLPGAEPPPDPEAALRADLDLLAEAFASGGPVDVWAGESLQDLMFLACCAAFGGPAARLRLRRPGAGEAPLSGGLAALPPARLRDAAEPHPLSSDELAGLRRFWSALTAPNAEALPALLDHDLGPPSGLAAALRARLARLPDRISGLESIEARVLSPLSADPRPVARVIGEVLAAGAAGPDLVGDLSLFHALRTLADPSLPRPLVALSGDGTIRGSEAAFTPFGAEVRAGRADRVATNGWRQSLGGLEVDAAPGEPVPRAPAP